MANGTYGVKKPAYITADDVEIFYYYRPNRNSESPDFQAFKKVEDPAAWFSQCYIENGEEILPGMYDLKLPVEEFGKKGIYTIYIKPREINAVIADVSTLTGNFSNIRGIVIENTGGWANGDLVGWRVEYFKDDTRLEDYRIITSNNLCEPVSQNMNTVTQKSVRYRFNNSSNLMFCTLTPTAAMSFNQTNLPSLGLTGQKIRLVNTKFNPVALEIEMVDYDEEGIATMLEGDQVRDLNHGIITTFDSDGNIYHQARYGNITNVAEGMNSDFKIAYRETYIRSEKDDYETIKEQANVE